ncbi:hypothetical protein ACLOAU_02740 [Niabella sp. CJ426]|uniref:hypothetical protein n=1 Tax=Niabella sp. CJ426 TaxID=3393740 RepID=UPI003D003A0C
MKKKIIGLTSLFLCFQIISITAYAQRTIQLGSGILLGNAIPINSDYFYSYTQAIYTKSEMNAAGATTAGTISKIRYQTVNVTPSVTWDYWTIYIRHTTVDSFVTETDWVPVSNLNQVYEASLPLLNVSQANTWMELTLSSPFHWNGTDNIVIAVDENRPLGNIQWQYWRSYQPTTGPGYARGLYYGTDVNNPNPVSPPAATSISQNIPQVQFEFTPDGTLPVTFGSVSAKSTASGLQVNWQTFNETNVDHFEVLVSTDGENFKSIGKLASKGINGNSSDKLNYSFLLPVTDLQDKMSFAYIPFLFAVGLLLTFINRRTKQWVGAPLIFVLVISGFSCRKHQGEVLIRSGRIFIKIQQTDKDGAKSSSSTVKAQID